MQSVELLQKEQGGVQHSLRAQPGQRGKAARSCTGSYRKLGIDNIQFIPLAEFDARRHAACRSPSRAEQYGRFMCEIFDLWWPERRKVRIRCFDNIAEALAGQKPGNCTMHETCDSYVVVEYNGDVYPVRFLRGGRWKLGNVNRRFLGRDRAPHASATASPPRRRSRIPSARSANTSRICHGGCPKFRHGPHGSSKIWITSARRTR